MNIKNDLNDNLCDGKEKIQNSNNIPSLRFSKSNSNQSMNTSLISKNSNIINIKKNNHKEDNLKNINTKSSKSISKTLSNKSKTHSKKSTTKSIKIDNNKISSKKNSNKDNNINEKDIKNSENNNVINKIDNNNNNNPTNNNNNNTNNNNNPTNNNNKELIHKSWIRLNQRTNTLNYGKFHSFKSFFEKSSLINFGQNRIKEQIKLANSVNPKKLLPDINKKQLTENNENISEKSEEKLKYVYSNSNDENNEDNKYNNNIIFLSKFSNKKKVKTKLIKCIKQKSSELFLSNKRKNSKDYIISPFNKYTYTSTNFFIPQNENFLPKFTHKYIADTIINNSINNNNCTNFNKYTYNLNLKNDLINNNKNSINDINFNTINIQSTKSIKSIQKNNDIKNINENNYSTLNVVSFSRLKNDNITPKNKVHFSRKLKTSHTIMINNNFHNNFHKNLKNKLKNLFNNKSTKKIKTIKKNGPRKSIINNNSLDFYSKKNNVLKFLFNHNNKNFQKLDYIEKDYLREQKVKIEKIIIKDDFINQRCNNNKLIKIKKDFLDNEITNFMEKKCESLIPSDFFIDKDILYNSENKEKEDTLYNNLKSQKKYMGDTIYIDYDLKTIKKYIKNFCFSNKKENINLDISLYKINIIDNKEIRTDIIQYLNRHYDLFNFIYNDIIFKNISLKKIQFNINNQICHNIEEEYNRVYNLLKTNLFLSVDFIKLNQKFQKPFTNIEINRENAWNDLYNMEKSAKQNYKGKRINITKAGKKQSSYLTLLSQKSLKKEKEKEKEKEKKEKKEKKSITSLVGVKRSLSISRNLYFKEHKKERKNSKKSLFINPNKTKFSIVNLLNNNINQNKNIIIIGNNNNNKYTNENNKNSNKTISENDAEDNISAKYETQKLKDFEESSDKVNKFQLSLNKNIFGRSKDIYLKTETLESKINKIIKEESNKVELNNKKNEMIFKFSGYETLTQESLILKLKELEDNLPFAKLFNQFLLLIEKGKEVLFEELLQEEEKNFSKAGKSIVDFLNVKHSLTGNTLLIYAVQNAEKNIVHSLLKRKCDPNIQNIFGNTALHMAYKLNNFSIVYLLKQNGASDNVKNKSGYTPYQMAFLNGYI